MKKTKKIRKVDHCQESKKRFENRENKKINLFFS